MKRLPSAVIFLALITLIIAALRPAAALAVPHAQVAVSAVPTGFSLLTAGRGVQVYLSEEEPPEEEPETAEEDGGEDGEEDVEPVLRKELMQVIDLSTGARLTVHHGAIVERTSDGIYGGPNPRIQRQYLETVWAVAAEEPDAFCVSNGTFFLDMRDGARVDPTVLSFPLKRDGIVISEGDENRRFRSARVMLELYGDHATIRPLGREAFYSSDAPDVVTGLSPRASLRSLAKVGRSWIGTADHDGDGQNETIYLYSALAVTQTHAQQVMRAFGAEEMLMLDGGGSTQLICQGDGYIMQSRPLPQTLITLQAPPPPLPWPIPRTPVFGVW